jgi:hypothetical protein
MFQHVKPQIRRSARYSTAEPGPILLPESDMAYWLTVIAINPDGGPQAT